MRITPEVVSLFEKTLTVPLGAEPVDNIQMARIVCNAFHGFYCALAASNKPVWYDKDLTVTQAAETAAAYAFNARNKPIRFGGGFADEEALNARPAPLAEDAPRDPLTRAVIVKYLAPLMIDFFMNHTNRDEKFIGLEAVAHAAGAVSNQIGYAMGPQLARTLGVEDIIDGDCILRTHNAISS